MQGLCHRGVSSFLCSGGNAVGLQTPVTRQLNPKKGVLLEGKGKQASEQETFPDTPATCASTCSTPSFSGSA